MVGRSIGSTRRSLLGPVVWLPIKRFEALWRFGKQHMRFISEFVKMRRHIANQTLPSSQDVLPQCWYLSGRWLSNVYKGRGWTYGLVVQYPKHKWEPWRFNPVASYVWDDIQNRRGLLDAYMKDLNMTRMEDWYDVNMEKIDHSLHGTCPMCQGEGILLKRFFF
jgi:hypothetical protein